jgi:hypothetical protein
MSNGAADPSMHGGEEVDPGEPVTELAAFEHDVSTRLISRIRHTIQRRTTAAQFTSFAFHLPLVVLKELWLVMVGQFNLQKVEKEARNERKAP